MSDISGSSSTPTGMTGAGGGQLLRITGMATGLDVDSMVKKMMLAEQTKLDQVKQGQQLIIWRQQAYQDIIKDIKDLQNSFFDPLTPSNNLLSASNYNNLVTSSTNAAAINATAQTGAATGTYTINVTQIAQSASLVSNRSLNSQFQVTNANNWSGAGNSITFSVDGVNAPAIDLSGFTPSGDNSKDLPNLTAYINNQISNNTSLNGKVSASYVQDASGNNYIKFNTLTTSAIQITSTGVSDIPSLNTNFVSASTNTKLTSLDSTLNTNLSLNINYNGKAITVNLDNSATGKNGTATINDLITAIKTATGGQVTGNFDDMTGKFTLQTVNTGSNAGLSITGNSLTSALGFTGSPSSQGLDAIVKITPPGASTPTTITENSNNFTLNNISYSLTAAGTSTITINTNTQGVHDKIKAFLDKYNAIIDKIQTKLNEKKNSDYPPLTDTQKSSMKDSDITAWNAKAQQGILRNDNNLQKLLSDLRSAFVSPVTDATGKNVSSVYFGSYGSGAIGIDTPNGANTVTDGDKISISDDNKLNNAILNHGDDLIKLFTNVATDNNGKQIFNQSGIFQRINNVLQNNVGYTGTTFNSAILTKYANVQDDYSISGGAGTNTLPDQIYYKQVMITKMTDAMTTKQEQYYQQFSQLETAMNTLNAQQAQLSQLTSG
ncbi:flagellar filament capping protein FliD [Candidatus Clostridium radicumherbarum]|uniref:Flagellar hook-associated protein 2 n=1 Tax=Candidatus Clostridium radicumherbarum TaxID=3381662 RepID=A0ABW8TVP5_9CLOT